MTTRRRAYAALAAVVFVVELIIASGRLGRGFVRGSVGDILVIVLLYFVFRAGTSLSRARAAGLGILCGFAVEALQYVHLADALGLRKGGVLAIVIGSTASVGDLGMYVVGGVLAVGVDRLLFGDRVDEAPTV